MNEIIQSFLLIAILYFVAKKPNSGRIINEKENSSNALILDTCALIDGRIIEIVKSGFAPAVLIVPEFVLHELQLLADGSDAHKRERARYGLDVVRELKENTATKVVIERSKFESIHEVDAKLVALAKKLKVDLYTTDFNLNKVADIEGIRVLNVNELAQHVRPIAIPGEFKTVKITQRGSNQSQGVGYLEDGTMIVVDNAASYIGKSLNVEVTRIHQTAAGKMLFGVHNSKQPRTTSRKPKIENASEKTIAIRRRYRTNNK